MLSHFRISQTLFPRFIKILFLGAHPLVDLRVEDSESIDLEVDFFSKIKTLDINRRRCCTGAYACAASQRP
ncbi:unnamed protein product [Spirodela intermedia]|uniref:Uncharacterized protein n=1 Tax=Spirodela intermedia TaxID=51605 RepID=A0A7I8JXU5_SPIIN|nr:unnamed protein product [Spirodela intermedia]